MTDAPAAPAVPRRGWNKAAAGQTAVCGIAIIGISNGTYIVGAAANGAIDLGLAQGLAAVVSFGMGVALLYVGHCRNMVSPPG